jgi:hypothetical protein
MPFLSLASLASLLHVSKIPLESIKTKSKKVEKRRKKSKNLKSTIEGSGKRFLEVEILEMQNLGDGVAPLTGPF